MVRARESVGLIGFGAIGRDLCGRLTADGFGVTVLLREGSASRPHVPPGVAVVASLDALMAAAPDLVVEAAGQAVLRDAAAPLLRAGFSVVAASTGALGLDGLFDDLAQAARAGRSRLIVSPGALGGLDYLAALHGTEGARVRYTSRKPPAAWLAELAAIGVQADRLVVEVLLFEGSAAEAARRYPRNLNAGLTVALAAGAAMTEVRVIADPAVTLNTHEIAVDSPLGSASMRFANRPAADNPKTSALTAAGLAASVRRLFDPVVL